MKPGIYEDFAAVDRETSAHWEEHGYRFGGWQFLPSTGEIRQDGVGIGQLPWTLAEMLIRLLDAYPAYILVPEAERPTIFRLRRALGQDIIVAVRSWGYRFDPKVVM